MSCINPLALYISGARSLYGIHGYRHRDGLHVWVSTHGASETKPILSV